MPYSNPEPVLFVMHRAASSEEHVQMAVISSGFSVGMARHTARFEINKNDTTNKHKHNHNIHVILTQKQQPNTRFEMSPNISKLKFQGAMDLGVFSKEDLASLSWWEALFSEAAQGRPRGTDFLYDVMLPDLQSRAAEDAEPAHELSWKSPHSGMNPSFFRCYKLAMRYILVRHGATRLQTRLFSALLRAELLQLASLDVPVHDRIMEAMPGSTGWEHETRSGILLEARRQLTTTCLKLMRDHTDLERDLMPHLQELRRQLDASAAQPESDQPGRHVGARPSGVTGKSFAMITISRGSYEDAELHPFFDSLVRQRVPNGMVSKASGDKAGADASKTTGLGNISFLRVAMQSERIDSHRSAVQLLESCEKLCSQIDSSPMAVAMAQDGQRVSHVVFTKVALLVDLFLYKLPLPLPEGRSTPANDPWRSRDMTRGDQAQILQLLLRLLEQFAAAVLTISRTSPEMWPQRVLVSATVLTIADAVVRNPSAKTSGERSPLARVWSQRRKERREKQDGAEAAAPGPGAAEERKPPLRFGICMDVFEELTARQALNIPQLAASRAGILAYHRSLGPLAPSNDIFGFEHQKFCLTFSKHMRGFLAQISSRLMFAQDEGTLSKLLTGEDSRFEQICPEFGSFRDIMFYAKMFLAPLKFFEDMANKVLAPAHLHPAWSVEEGVVIAKGSVYTLGRRVLDLAPLRWDKAEPAFYLRTQDATGDVAEVPPEYYFTLFVKGDNGYYHKLHVNMFTYFYTNYYAHFPKLH